MDRHFSYRMLRYRLNSLRRGAMPGSGTNIALPWHPYDWVLQKDDVTFVLLPTSILWVKMNEI
eukprot:scaffold581399_cov11-Prasinocladus_malaysianus.AAC.1